MLNAHTGIFSQNIFCCFYQQKRNRSVIYTHSVFRCHIKKCDILRFFDFIPQFFQNIPLLSQQDGRGKFSLKFFCQFSKGHSFCDLHFSAHDIDFIGFHSARLLLILSAKPLRCSRRSGHSPWSRPLPHPSRFLWPLLSVFSAAQARSALRWRNGSHPPQRCPFRWLPGLRDI